jgi:hypothetical protein
MKANCNCCTDTSHSMVLDGIIKVLLFMGRWPFKSYKDSAMNSNNNDDNQNKEEDQLAHISVGQAILEGNLSTPKNA